MIYKIINFITPTGQADYKGLDIDRFTPGRQLYPADFSFCVIMTDEEFQHNDITEITQQEYDDIKKTIQENTPKTDAEKLEDLQSKNDQLTTDIRSQNQMMSDFMDYIIPLLPTI